MMMRMTGIYVIKFGGNTLADPANVKSLASELLYLQKKGYRIVVVHGGGNSISAEMKARGLVPHMVGGQRITDGPAMDCVETVLERINRELVSEFTGSGIRATGLGAFEFTRSAMRPPYHVIEDGVEKVYDLGLCGYVTDVDPAPLLNLLDSGIIPVVYPVGTDGERKLNVNADTMSGGIAVGIGAEELLAVTDVPGIMTCFPDPASKLDTVTVSEVEKLIADGTISGGMIPKVEAAVSAVRSGAKAVRMVDGTGGKNEITKSIEGEPVGTLIVKE